MINFKKYWLNKANNLQWKTFPRQSYNKYKNNKFSWFEDGKLDVYKNLVNLRKDYGIYFVNTKKKIKYVPIKTIDKNVNNFCLNIIDLKKKFKIKKVILHCSSSEESCLSMLAFTRLGIHFSVIFEELSMHAINQRIQIFKPDLILSKNNIYLNNLKQLKINKNIKFLNFDKLIKLNTKDNKIIKNKIVKSNDNFFTLFTSGTTGEPKGITHSYGGYLLYSKLTCMNQFGLKEKSLMFTASDAGWINGHTYALFGPMSLCCSSILIERPALILEEKFLLEIIKLKVQVLYLPVTLIRMMKSFFGNNIIKSRYLKTLGSMGEPLAPEVAKWYSNKFNLNSKSIVNTYFQTETGGIISSPNYKNLSKKILHGSIGNPMTNKIKLTKLDKEKKEIKILSPWPGCMKDIINGLSFWKKYWDKDGNFKLFDEGYRFKNNNFVSGRTDDVINIRGHRVGSAEIESILLKNKNIIEACAISINDFLEGKVLIIFIVSKKNIDKKVNTLISENFGTFALPKKIIYTPELPKTRSGKIMRRLLRDLIENPTDKDYGDTTTLLNPNIIKYIKNEIQK